MNTVIFKWYPAFSSYPMIQYLQELNGLIEYEDYNFNWSVWDHNLINKGDRFYWVKLGFGQTGIVASGTITSDPYCDEDWSGKSRETYYVDFEPDVMINPDTLPILTNDELSRAIPDFEWTRGHSGLVLNPQQAATLDTLWNNFLARNEGYWTKALDARNHDQLWMKK